MLPAFAACEGAKVVAICSAHRENAQAAAQEHDIRGIYTDYEAMLDGEDLDFAVIVTPPHLHHRIALAALQRKLNVLCEKPTAMNLEEARQMYEMAQKVGVLHLIDHELRFNPTLVQLKELIRDGYLGAPESVSFSIQWGYPMDPDRPWGWWFDQTKGGGLLGALGSHQVDLLRWLLGEFKAVNAHLHTFVKERGLPNSREKRAVTSDDYCSFMAELEGGSVGTVVLSATARLKSDHERWTIAFHGEKGSLVYDGQRRLWGMREQKVEEFTQPDPLAHTSGLPEGLFSSSFLHFARRIIPALQSGQVAVDGAATFYDGMCVQAVLDAIRLSHEQGRWVDCPKF
jgi:predicted dehydrogenase